MTFLHHDQLIARRALHPAALADMNQRSEKNNHSIPTICNWPERSRSQLEGTGLNCRLERSPHLGIFRVPVSLSPTGQTQLGETCLAKGQEQSSMTEVKDLHHGLSSGIQRGGLEPGQKAPINRAGRDGTFLY